MRWERNPPCLILQWLDNTVVSMLSTVDIKLMITVLSTGKERSMVCGA